MTTGSRSQIGWRFWLIWTLINGIGWPISWLIGSIVGGTFNWLIFFFLIMLLQSFEPRDLMKRSTWLWVTYGGLYSGFEFSGRAGYSNLNDLLAVGALSAVANLAIGVIVALVLLGPIWLFFSFASLICAAERAKWRDKLFPSSAKSFAIKTAFLVVLFAATAALGGSASLLARNLGQTAGWSMSGTEFNLAARLALGITCGAITGLILRWILRHRLQQSDQSTSSPMPAL